ncbi:hypothetical protein [Streptomyces broussonetiae]|uniref:hypothetical protein n=1 Tax=Streptomyces broussonetiae TaxID=2686304 RepID=UPI001E380FAE|nr:hypothetical protein [Streptomyces broussonetiae]
MTEQKSSSALTAPLRGAASVLRMVPGGGVVKRAAEETLDRVGAVSPRSRRMAVYAGAGLLGAAGVVEWPVALTGAAVAWLTQPRPTRPADGGQGAQAAASTGGAGLSAADGGAGEPPGPVAVGERESDEGPAARHTGRAGPAHDLGTAALKSAEGSAQGARMAPGAGRTGPAEVTGGAGAETSGKAGNTTVPDTSDGTGGPAPDSGGAAWPHGGTSRFGPTARPGRTTS